MNKKKGKIIALRTLMIIIISVWLISGLLSWYFFKNWSRSASFGDTFGAINSLFSGLALAGIIYTIYLQKTELSLQRKELKYTREELKRTAIAQEDSAKSMSTQMRLANYPYLEFDSEFDNKEKYLTILNKNDNVAFDIEITIFSFILQTSYSYSKFISEYLTESYKNKKLDVSLVDNTLWAISDFGFYPSISKNKKILIPTQFPIDEGNYSLFIQYRDILGNNYSNLIHFNKYSDYETIDEKPFSGIRISPDYPKIADRIKLYDEKTQNGDLPNYVTEAILYKKASINLSMTNEIENIRSNDFKWKVTE